MAYDSIFRPGLFDGQHIVVTGGGSGIGRCTAHELAALGAKLALVGRTPEKLRAVADEIAQAGAHRPSCHACDIRVEDEVGATVAAAIGANGPIDGLVNNAGGQFPSPMAQISAKGFDAVVRNNLTGGFLMARETYLQSMRSRGGAIVNILADMWRSMPGMAHSGAARAGMLNLTETAAVEWGGDGVRVNAVAPGFIASSGLGRYPESFRPTLRKVREYVPLKRLGTESEVSAAIVFLLSPASAFISGSCLRVDGAHPNARRDWELAAHGRSQPYRGFPLESALDFLDEPDAPAADPVPSLESK
jgi:citronellol/citronellal dehydrogenase